MGALRLLQYFQATLFATARRGAPLGAVLLFYYKCRRYLRLELRDLGRGHPVPGEFHSGDPICWGVLGAHMLGVAGA